jgi:penicillin amidase
VPVFVAGATDDIAWGATRLAADVVDLVELDPHPDDPERYRTHTGWATFTRTRHQIGVRGADPVEIETRGSVFGPVTGPPLDGRPLALHWAALEPGGVDLGLSRMLTVRNVDEAATAARAAGGPALNLLFADRDGATGWAVTGRHPDRPAHCPAGVVRPRRGESSWTATIPPDRLPAATDPRGGVFISANNRVPEHGPLAPNQFSACRAARLGELLDRTGLREADLLAAQADQDAGFYGFYRDLALEVLTPGDELRDDIEAWDGTAHPDAVGLAALVLFRELLRNAWLSALLAGCVQADPEFRYYWHSHEAQLRAQLSAPLAPPPYPDRAAFLRTELGVCAAILAKRAPGRDPGKVRWGELNPAGARHPLSALRPDLDLPGDPPGGCMESVCATSPGFGPAMRFVTAPGRLADALVNLPGGQSGDPDDPAYRDQFAAWLTAQQRPLLDTPAGVETWIMPGGQP